MNVKNRKSASQQNGCRVTVVHDRLEACRDGVFLYRQGLLTELEKAGVEIICNVQLAAISAGEVVLAACGENAQQERQKADLVIIATGFSPLDDEAEQFRSLAYDFWKIGDCCQARKIFNARREGYNAGAYI